MARMCISIAVLSLFKRIQAVHQVLELHTERYTFYTVYTHTHAHMHTRDTGDVTHGTCLHVLLEVVLLGSGRSLGSSFELLQHRARVKGHP